MILYANIDDKSLIINEVLPIDLFKKVSHYNYKNIKNKKINISHEDWENSLYKDNYKNTTMQQVKTVNYLANYKNGEYEYIDKIFKDVLDIIICCEWLPFQKNSSLSLSYYEYDKYAGINWHDDGNQSLNYSLYIHDEWDKNWGGETLIDTGRGLPLCVSPVTNSMVTIKSKVPHKVCAVTGPKKRKVLQIRGIFFNN
tara:strand:- start:987 stop:1580 length:594 start_codon:yes stop_codon:yes gene_type:complete